MIIFSDVDGELTDGCYYEDSNLNIVKGFNTRDFHAINKFSSIGFNFVFLTASKDECTVNKFAKYNLELIYNCQSKKQSVINYCESKGIATQDCIFIGDGPQDLGAMMICGQSFCPSDASCSVKKCTYVRTLSSPGGRGVIDEVLYECFKNQYEKLLLL